MAHAIPGKTLASWAFTYDQAGQLRTDGEDAYGYDALGRLVKAEVRDPLDPTAGHGLQQVMSYDAFGNRTGLTSQKVTNWTDPTQLPGVPSLTALATGDHRVQSYAMTSGEIATMGAMNRLPSTVGGVSTGALYDAQGNLTQIWTTPGSSASQLTLTYDALGRVTTLGDTANATSQAYGYDDEGLRIKVTDSKTSLVKYNLYDESRHLIAQYEVPSGGSLTWKKDLIYVGAKEIAEVDSASKTWVQFEDHLGSPRYEWDGTATTTIDGVHLIAQKYAPFGEYLNDATTLAKFGKGFTDHEQTDPSGLIYMQARFYAPMYGRFLSPDPARDQHFEATQSWNIYSYVQNNPTMRIDPTGMIGDGADSVEKKDDKTKAEEEKVKAQTVAGALPALPSIPGTPGKVLPLNPITGTAGVPETGNGSVRGTESNPHVGEQGWTRTGAGGKPKFHAGTDLVAPNLTDVHASIGGKITYMDYKNDVAGVTITISGKIDGHTVVTSYKHLSFLTLTGWFGKNGDVVHAGQTIGLAGSTGNAKDMTRDQQHTHFEVHEDGSKINPRSFLQNGW